jgi:hypothetical protein
VAHPPILYRQDGTRGMSRRPLRDVFVAPAAIALTGLTGLVAGLLGTGAFDWFAWAGLATPLLAIGWAWAVSAPE